MWIDRFNANTLIQMGKQFPVVIITGARQVGKTSLLQRVFPDASYVSLDDPIQAARAQQMPLDFLNSLSKPAIIDEAQYVPTLFRYLKILVDKDDTPGQFFITGSQNFSLMHNVAESLAGRCGINYLYTLSAHEIKNSLKSIDLGKVIITGDIEIFYKEENISHDYWFSSYMATYLERDIRNIINVTSLMDFNRFIRAVALRTGQILSYSDLARDIGLSPNTAKAWMSTLLTSQQVYLLEPYHRSLGKRLTKSPKIYFCDTGLAAYLIGLRTWEDIIRSPLCGALWETYVFNQILRFFTAKSMSSPIWFWQTQSGQEVDFLIEKGGQFIAFEAKFKSTPVKSDLTGLKALANFYGSDSIIRKYIACKTHQEFPLSQDIMAINAIDLEGKII